MEPRVKTVSVIELFAAAQILHEFRQWALAAQYIDRSDIDALITPAQLLADMEGWDNVPDHDLARVQDFAFRLAAVGTHQEGSA